MTQITFARLHCEHATCPSELALDKLFAEALEPAEREALQTHITTCEHCAGRLELRRTGLSAFPLLDEQKLLQTIQNRLAEPRAASPSGPICIVSSPRNSTS